MEGQTTTSQVLHEENGIRYEHLETKHVTADLKETVWKANEAEPLLMMTGVNKKPELVRDITPVFHLELISQWTVNNGLSTVAIDVESGRCIGVFTALDPAKMEKEVGFGFIMKMIPVMNKVYKINPRQKESDAFLQNINDDLNAERKMIKSKYLKSQKDESGIICEMGSLSVHPDFQGKGIAKHLTRLILEAAKKKGFWMSKAECSGAFSAKALAKFGANCEKFFDYGTHEIPGGCCKKPYAPFKKDVIEPHKGMSLMIFRHFPEGKDDQEFVNQFKKKHEQVV